MFPAIMYVLHLEKHKMQKIKNHNIGTEKQSLRGNCPTHSGTEMIISHQCSVYYVDPSGPTYVHQFIMCTPPFAKTVRVIVISFDLQKCVLNCQGQWCKNLSLGIENGVFFLSHKNRSLCTMNLPVHDLIRQKQVFGRC